MNSSRLSGNYKLYSKDDAATCCTVWVTAIKSFTGHLKYIFDLMYTILVLLNTTLTILKLWCLCFVLKGCLTPCQYVYLRLGDHRPLPRAWQQWIQAGLPRSCQGEGEGWDDHLLPHQWPCGQVVGGGWQPQSDSHWTGKDCRDTQVVVEQRVTAQNGSRWRPAPTSSACLRVVR